jgi:Raf kinase inhibitor-like YbhB/YbcL family protein
MSLAFRMLMTAVQPRLAPARASRAWQWTFVTFAFALTAGYGAGIRPPDLGRITMQVTSSAFEHQREIPARFTCDGEDISPPLSWQDVPEDAVSLVLIVDDPDAPDPASPRMTWVHWLLTDMPASTPGLPEDVQQLPSGTVQGVNDWNRTEYGGPCPPVGRHRYFFKLYALDTKLDLVRPSKAAIESAMKGHVLARGELIGTYEKRR